MSYTALEMRQVEDSTTRCSRDSSATAQGREEEGRYSLQQNADDEVPGTATNVSRTTHDDTEEEDPSPWWCCFCWFLFSWMIHIRDGLGLLIYVVVLLPGFLRFAWYYFVTSSRTSITYGTKSRRQTLDVYTAAESDATSAVSSESTASDPRTRANNNINNNINNNTNSTIASSSPGNRTSFLATTPLLSSCWHGHDDTNGNTTTTTTRPLRPVVLFVCGGAWIMGYKMWAALTARVLTQFGIVTVVADYRNDPFFIFSCCCFAGCCCSCTHPQIPDMVDDVSAAIQWTVDHVTEYAGDPQRIVLVGQSAGGHLVTTALLQRAIQLQEQQQQQQQQQQNVVSTPQQSPRTTVPNGRSDNMDDNNRTARSAQSNQEDPALPPNSSETATLEAPLSSWRPCDLCGLVSVSAPYNFALMENTFRRHGLNPHQVLRGMFSKNNKNLRDYDPLMLVSQRHQMLVASAEHPCSTDNHHLLQLLPRIELWHGSRDATVPWQSSQIFAQALDNLQSVQSPSNRPSLFSVNFRLYPTWTHTDSIIEGPLSGSHEFHKDLFAVVKEWTITQESYHLEEAETVAWVDDHVVLKPMWCPQVLAHLGRFFMPF